MRPASGQERRHTRQPGIKDQDGHEDMGCRQASHNYATKKGFIIFKKDYLSNGFRINMKVQEKEAFYHVGFGIRPLTFVLLSLLFLIALFTITFPMTTSFDSEHDLLAVAQQQWSSSSRRAKEVIKMWEEFQGRETKFKMATKNREKMYAIRSRLSYWEDLTSILESVTDSGTNAPVKLGIINYDKTISHEEENELWGLLTSVDVVPHMLPLEHANRTLTWKDFYPEWIDEEQVFEVPQCPLLPMPELEGNATLDVMFAEVPCDASSDWRRDVLRLHLQLSVADAATKSNSSHVVLFSACSPFPNLLTCEELLLKRGHLWLYKADLPKLRRKLALPRGSCELAVPLKEESLQEMMRRGGDGGGGEGREGATEKSHSREAYATILHSGAWEAGGGAGGDYLCGAIALGHSIRRTGSRRDMVVLVVVDEGVERDGKNSSSGGGGAKRRWWERQEEYYRRGLEAAGWKVVAVEGIRNPHAQPDSYNEWNYSKLRLWQLTEYRKLVFVDADALVLRNMDFLFEGGEELSASGNSRTVFNSGVMVIEPSNCTFRLLMSLRGSIVSYNGGDQGFLNDIFTWWHRLPRRMNFLKHFHTNSQEEWEEKTRLFGMDPPLLYVLHFLGYKPWLCFRDYDCSWHFPDLHKFASDVAHATWWNIYDSMPPHLQRFCTLTQNQTDLLSYDIATAKLSPNPDPYQHLRWNISDPRFLHPS